MQETYKDALRIALSELSQAVVARNELEARQLELDERIHKLRAGIVGISSLAGEDWGRLVRSNPNLFPDLQSTDAGMTDSIRKVLQSGDFLSPVEVRSRLEALGFDVGQYTNILSSIHTILKRLVEAGEAETSTIKNRTVYRRPRGHKMFKQGTTTER